MNKGRYRIAFRTGIAAVLALPFLLPFFFLITVAIKPMDDYFDNPIGIPRTITFEYVIDAWNRAELGSALFNSLFVSVVGVTIASLLCLSAAFWFFTNRSQKTKILRQVMMIGYAFPAVIWLIPLFVILARNNLTNKLFVLGVIYGVSNVPFGLYLVYTFFRQTLKPEIIEAATIDGAGTLQQFISIAIPLSLPALSALAALVFVWSMGDLLFAVTVLQDSSKWTIPIAAATLVSKQSISTQAQAAAAFVSLIPSLFIVLIAQRALVRGFGGGSSTG